MGGTECSSTTPAAEGVPHGGKGVLGGESASPSPFLFFILLIENRIIPDKRRKK